MSTWETQINTRQRAHSLSHGEDGIPQKIQRQAEFTSNWSIPATHGSPSVLLKTKQSPNVETERIPSSKLVSVFEDLDRQCQERSSRIEAEAKEALRTQLTAWIRSREKLYLTQLRDASEQFRKTTLEAVEQRQAAEYSQALAHEKAKLADEYHNKLKEAQDEREQLVQRRMDLVRQMEEAAGVAGPRYTGENSHSLEVHSQQKEIALQINIAENLDELNSKIKAAEEQAQHAREELAAAVHARDQALESLENAKFLQQTTILESKTLEMQYNKEKIVWQQTIDAKESKVEEFKTVAEGARAEISSLKAELQAVQLKLAAQGEAKLSETERNTLLERAETAEAAATAAEEAKKELERCIAAAEVARTAAESQASNLRHRLEGLLKENSALQKSMIAAGEAVRVASTTEKASAADRAALLKKVAETKDALATHRAAITQLESQLKEERTHRESLQVIAQNAETLQIEAAAWEEKTLRHAEDTRLRLAAALRDIEAVCLAARALGQSSSSNNKKYTAPLLHTIQESEENAAEATVWLREAHLEGKALASSAPGSSSSITE
jgi:hypothetical protein